MKIIPNIQLLTFSKLLIIVASLTMCSVSVAQASEISVENVIALTNKDRVANSAPELIVNELLTKAAEAKVNDMIQHGYFAHTSPQGLTPWFWIQKFNYDYEIVGENLAIRFASAEEQEAAWMESVKHRENILNPRYKDIGVAFGKIMNNGQKETVVVQMFGLNVRDAQQIAEGATNTLSIEDARLQGQIAAITSMPISAQENQKMVDTRMVNADDFKKNQLWENKTFLLVISVMLISFAIGFFLAVLHYQNSNKALVSQKERPLTIKVEERKNAYIK